MANRSKILLVFDLNCTLGYRQKTKFFTNEIIGLENVKAHINKDNCSTFYRPNSEILLKQVFKDKANLFDVGVWANQNKEETNIQVQQFFSSLRYSMKFVLFTKKTELKNEESELIPEPINRDLKKYIFEKNPQFSETNTVVISNFENLNTKYKDNDVVIPLYHPKGTTNFTRDAHLFFLHEYLGFIIALYNSGKGKFFLIFLVADIREALKQIKYDHQVRVRTGSNNPDKYYYNTIDDVRI